MINLLPPKTLVRVHKEYWVRTLSVWGLLFSFVFIIAALLLSPSYVLLSSSSKVIETELQDNKNTETQFTAAKEEIEAANAFARQLDRPGPLTSATNIIKTVESVAGPDILLRTFSIDKSSADFESIQIQGTAASRSALANFKEDLEREALFENAVVPISDLAREQDLPFMLTLTIASIRR